MKTREIEIIGFWLHPDYPENGIGSACSVYQTQYVPNNKEFNELVASGDINKYQIVLLDKEVEKEQALKTNVTYYKDLKNNDLDNE